MNFSNLTYEITRRYVQDHRHELGDEVCNKILGWVRCRSLSHLASCREHFSDENIVKEKYRHLLQIEAFFKKNAVFADPDKCLRAARLSFERAERICRITNRRLDFYYIQRDRIDPDLNLWLSRAEANVRSTLGDFSTFLEEMPRLLRFTSGATSTRSRRKSYPFLKISKKPVCTPGAAPYLSAISQWFGYGRLKEKLTTSNRVEVVPKSWKTHRTIACEPEGNVPLQLAFDGYAKRRLRRIGIDLSDQTRNQELAKEGSRDNSLATIDLSMASDTVAFNTVAWLFPEPWFRYLNAIRCSHASGKFGEFPYAKFSSMGNGATFAIETLIFAALAAAVGSKRYAVYGDDIIIERELVPSLLKLLRFFGFQVNQDKSYTDGPFRESCGSNWFNGTNITPFYLRSWSRVNAEICHNINGLASIARPWGSLWELLRDLIGTLKLPMVPWNYNTTSGILIDIPTSYSKKLIRSKRWQLKMKAYSPKSRLRRDFSMRSLFLWYLEKNRRPTLEFESSRYTISSHKYVRKWVHWIPPVAVVPVHLYGWTDYITRS